MTATAPLWTKFAAEILTKSNRNISKRLKAYETSDLTRLAGGCRADADRLRRAARLAVPVLAQGRRLCAADLRGLLLLRRQFAAADWTVIGI